MLRQAEGLTVVIGTDCNSWFRGWRVLMKAILSKSLIPAILVIAALAAGTSLLAGYIDGPTQAAVEAKCDGCPLLNTEACCKVTGVCASPQTCTNPCVGTAAETAPCTGVAGCPMPCCPTAGETPAAGCMMAKPQATGCPSMEASDQAVSPCCAGGCMQQK